MFKTNLPDIYPSNIGSEAVGDFAPIIDQYGDPNNHLAVYLHGLAEMLKQVDDISKDGDEGEPGWSQVFDLDRAKTEWLPWLGQIVGYDVPDPQPDTQTFEEYDATQRERILSRSSWRRGTTTMMSDVLKDHLMSPQRIIINERVGDNAYAIDVFVYAEDILTSEAEITKAAMSQKMAGLIMTFTVLTGEGSYDQLRAANASYSIVNSSFTDYQGALDNPNKD